MISLFVSFSLVNCSLRRNCYVVICDLLAFYTHLVDKRYNSAVSQDHRVHLYVVLLLIFLCKAMIITEFISLHLCFSSIDINFKSPDRLPCHSFFSQNRQWSIFFKKVIDHLFGITDLAIKGLCDDIHLAITFLILEILFHNLNTHAASILIFKLSPDFLHRVV